MPSLSGPLSIPLSRPLATPLAGLSSAPAETGASLQVDWTDDSTDEDGFRVELSNDSFSTIAETKTVGPNIETATIEGLLFNQEYSARVFAFNEEGDSAATVADADQTTLPDVPVGLAVAQGTGSDVDLTWSAPTGPNAGAASYKVEYKKSADGTWTTAEAAEATTSHTVTGLDGETSYDFRVSGNTSGGTGEATPVETITTGAAPASPVWYDSSEVGDLEDNVNLDNTTIRGSKITLPVSGTATGLRCYLAFVNSTSDLYLSLRDADGNHIDGGSVTVPDSEPNDSWHSLSINASVTAGDYWVLVSQNGPFGGALTGQRKVVASGDANYLFSTSYENIDTVSWGEFNDGTSQLGTGIEVTT